MMNFEEARVSVRKVSNMAMWSCIFLGTIFQFVNTRTTILVKPTLDTDHKTSFSAASFVQETEPITPIAWTNKPKSLESDVINDIKSILKATNDTNTQALLIGNIFNRQQQHSQNEFNRQQQHFQQQLDKESEQIRNETNLRIHVEKLNTNLTRDIMDLQKYVLVLSVRSRIEELERMFLGESKIYMPRRDKWNRIMRGETEGLKHLEELAVLRARIDPSAISDFIDTVERLYGDFSDTAAHNVKYPVEFDTESVSKMLQNIHISPDQSKVNAVVAILKPL